MSFEAKWTLPRRPWSEIEQVVRAVATPHELYCELKPQSDEELIVRVHFPVARAAELAAVLSDVYDSAEEAAEQLDPPRGDVDWDAAQAAGAVTVSHGGMIKALDRDREDEFTRYPDRYKCMFDIHWERDEPLIVYSNDGDNRQAWPVIFAFADAVAMQLGGEAVDE